MIVCIVILSEDYCGCCVCYYCGLCECGCLMSFYYLIQSVVLLVVCKMGKLVFVFDVLIESVFYDKGKNCVSGVCVFDMKMCEVIEYKVCFVFFCVLMFGMVCIFLYLKSECFFIGFVNSSDQVGCNIIEYYVCVGVLGFVDGFDDCYYCGNCLCGIYILCFWNLGFEMKYVDFVCGYGVQGGVGCMDWLCGQSVFGFGVVFKELFI